MRVMCICTFRGIDTIYAKQLPSHLICGSISRTISTQCGMVVKNVSSDIREILDFRFLLSV